MISKLNTYVYTLYQTCHTHISMYAHPYIQTLMFPQGYMCGYTHGHGHAATFERGGTEGPNNVYGLGYTCRYMDGWPPKYVKMETHKDTKLYGYMHIETHDNEN